MQKHETLVAEINANKKRLDDLENRGQELVNEDHYAAPEIAGNSGWMTDFDLVNDGNVYLSFYISKFHVLLLFSLPDILEKTRANWRGLADKTTGKGPNSKSHLLDQAVQQKTLNMNLKELHEWLDMAEMRWVDVVYEVKEGVGDRFQKNPVVAFLHLLFLSHA